MKQLSKKIEPLNVQVDLNTLAKSLQGYCFDNQIMMANITRLKENLSELTWQEDISIKVDIVCCVVVTEGTLSLTIDYKRVDIPQNSLLFISPFNIVEQPTLSPDGRYFVLIFKQSFAQDVVSNIYFNLDPKPIVSIAEHAPFIKLSESEMYNLQRRFQTLYYYLKEERGNLKRYFIMNSFLTIGLEFVHLINNNLVSDEDSAGKTGQTKISGSDNRKNMIIRNFMILLSEHCTTEHNPQFYAEKLFISVQYLSLILKEKTNQTASYWIANNILVRAKSMLKDPNTTIAIVAEKLNFSDQSSFGKFFKKHTGITPKKYIEMQM